MITTTSPTESFDDRKRLLKENIYPFIIKLPRFLGGLNYNDHFTHINNGQSNWEFRDKESKDIFHTSIVGKIAPTLQGTRLGAIGNYRTQKNETVHNSYYSLQNLTIQTISKPTPLQDGTKVKNVLALQVPTGSNTFGTKAFNNQFTPLNQIVDNVNINNDRLGQVRQSFCTIELSTLLIPPQEIYQQNWRPMDRH